MKKVIILRKIHACDKKSSTPPFSTIGKTLTYSCFSCRFLTYIIRIENLDWCKCERCKNGERIRVPLFRGGGKAYCFG